MYILLDESVTPPEARVLAMVEAVICFDLLVWAEANCWTTISYTLTSASALTVAVRTPLYEPEVSTRSISTALAL